MDAGRSNREFESQDFEEFLTEREANKFDQRNNNFRETSFSTLQLERIAKIIKHLSSPNQFSQDHPYTLEEFKKDIEGIDGVLYCLLGSAVESNIKSILSALLTNPSDQNLEIFFYLVNRYPDIEFHKAIDIRNASAFDPQIYLPGAIAESVLHATGEKIDVEKLKSNASRMLEYIDKHTSIGSKNKLGLANIAMLWDDVMLFERLVGNPNIYLRLNGARNGSILECGFLNNQRGSMVAVLLTNEGFNEKELGALNDKILIQMLGVLDPSSLSHIVVVMAQNFPSFAVAAQKALAFDFTAIASVPEVFGDKNKALKDAVDNYKLIFQCCRGMQLDFLNFFNERNIVGLWQNLMNLPIALSEYGVSPYSSTRAMVSVIEMMFLYQPQLIDTLPLSNGMLSANQRDAMFFSMLVKEDNMKFLDGICNANTAQYVQNFLQKSPEECKQILKNAGVSNNAQFMELCIKISVISGIMIPKELDSLDFEKKAGWFSSAPKVEKPVYLGDLLQSEKHVEYFMGGIANAAKLKEEQQGAKFADRVNKSLEHPRSRS